MANTIKRYFYWVFGILFFLTGLVGVVLPLLPTTPFMILSAACFAKSSPRFHQALLHNRWIGEDLRHWEQSHTIQRTTKRKATWVIITTFSLSIGFLWGKPWLQLMLLGIALLLLFFLWRVAEDITNDVTRAADDPI